MRFSKIFFSVLLSISLFPLLKSFNLAEFLERRHLSPKIDRQITNRVRTEHGEAPLPAPRAAVAPQVARQVSAPVQRSAAPTAGPSGFSGAPTAGPSGFSGAPTAGPSGFSGAPTAGPSGFSGAPTAGPSGFSAMHSKMYHPTMPKGGSFYPQHEQTQMNMHTGAGGVNDRPIEQDGLKRPKVSSTLRLIGFLYHVPLVHPFGNPIKWFRELLMGVPGKENSAFYDGTRPKDLEKFVKGLETFSQKRFLKAGKGFKYYTKQIKKWPTKEIGRTITGERAFLEVLHLALNNQHLSEEHERIQRLIGEIQSGYNMAEAEHAIKKATGTPFQKIKKGLTELLAITDPVKGLNENYADPNAKHDKEAEHFIELVKQVQSNAINAAKKDKLTDKQVFQVESDLWYLAKAAIHNPRINKADEEQKQPFLAQIFHEQGHQYLDFDLEFAAAKGDYKKHKKNATAIKGLIMHCYRIATRLSDLQTKDQIADFVKYVYKPGGHFSTSLQDIVYKHATKKDEWTYLELVQKMSKTSAIMDWDRQHNKGRFQQFIEDLTEDGAFKTGFIFNVAYKQAKAQKNDAKKIILLWEIADYSRDYKELEKFVKYLFSHYTGKRIRKLNAVMRKKLEEVLWGGLQKNPELKQWDKNGFFIVKGKKHSLSKFKAGFLMGMYWKARLNFDFKNEYKLAMKGSSPDRWASGLDGILKKIWGALSSGIMSKSEKEKFLKGVGKAYKKWLKLEKKGRANSRTKHDLASLVYTLEKAPAFTGLKVKISMFKHRTLAQIYSDLRSRGANHSLSKHHSSNPHKSWGRNQRGHSRTSYQRGHTQQGSGHYSRHSTSSRSSHLSSHHNNYSHSLHSHRSSYHRGYSHHSSYRHSSYRRHR
jgi:hypothetical protein